jgi:hypothetical protein
MKIFLVNYSSNKIGGNCYDSRLINFLKILPIRIITSIWAKNFPSFQPDVRASFSRRYLKSTSPQVPGADMQIIYAVFVGLVVREGFGK